MPAHKGTVTHPQGGAALERCCVACPWCTDMQHACQRGQFQQCQLPDQPGFYELHSPDRGEAGLSEGSGAGSLG